MKILVTGSEGSLAQVVIPDLLKAGHELVGIDNFARYGQLQRERRYELVAGDLCDSHAVRELFARQRFEAAFHFAALVYGVVGFHEKPADIIADNNLGTINLLKYGHQAIGKFIYLSSSMVYERCVAPHREDDTADAMVMKTSYGLSKYVGERVVQAYHQQYGTPYVIWRPFNVITPFETPEEEGYSHVFSDLVHKILRHKQQPLRVLGDGEQVRCFTSIFDVADAVARFSLDSRAENEVFNLGNPEPLTVKELAGRIVALGKRLAILPDEYELAFAPQPIHADDVRRRIPDVSKMERVFGWTARRRADESLETYVKRMFQIP